MADSPVVEFNRVPIPQLPRGVITAGIAVVVAAVVVVGLAVATVVMTILLLVFCEHDQFLFQFATSRKHQYVIHHGLKFLGRQLTKRRHRRAGNSPFDRLE